MTLTEFLLARIAEDEADGPRHADWCGSVGTDEHGCDCDGASRVLAECEAKRRIVEGAGGWLESDPNPPHWAVAVMRDLASVYADRPDYRQEWKP